MTEFVNVPVPSDRVQEVYELLATRTVQIAPGITATGTPAELAGFIKPALTIGTRYDVTYERRGIHDRVTERGRFIGTLVRTQPSLLFREIEPVVGEAGPYRMGKSHGKPQRKTLYVRELAAIKVAA